MAVTNTNIFDADKRFIDLTGLDTFWTEAKKYIDGVDTSLSKRIDGVDSRTKSLENTVNGYTPENGDKVVGLVEKVATLRSEMDSLGGGAGSVASQIQNAIEALNLPNTYEAKGAAAQALIDAKGYADGLNTAMDTRVAALEDGKDAYKAADETVLASAKSYADGKVADEAQARKDADDALQGAITTLRGEYEATKGRIDTFLDSTEVDETVNTLHEIAEWMKGDGVNATELTEAIAAEAKLRGEADEALGGRIDGLAGTVATNLQDAKKYTDEAIADLGIADYAKTTEVTSAIATAKSEVMIEVNKKADKGDLDSAVSTLEGKITAAKDAAIADAAKKLESYYTKEQINTTLADYYTKTEINTTLANYYTKDQIYTKNEVEGAFNTNLANYYDKTVVDNKLTENSTADQTYARAYTDLLFSSVKFAKYDDILGVFND